MRVHEDSVMIARRADLVWAICSDEQMIMAQLGEADADLEKTGPNTMKVRFNLTKAREEAKSTGNPVSPGLANVQLFPENRAEVTLLKWDGDNILRRPLITFTLTPVGDGTRLTMTIDGEPSMGMIGRTLVKTAMKTFQPKSHARLEQLAHDVEQVILDMEIPTKTTGQNLNPLPGQNSVSSSLPPDKINGEVL